MKFNHFQTTTQQIPAKLVRENKFKYDPSLIRVLALENHVDV